ncbi:MAG TPA: MMPL family transporter, partial [Solirubrobacteraceae bacterium]|nr:MMPL family transporter [Solirubrobacteraceae bacterium]
ADYSTPGSDSKAASERLREAFPDQSTSTVDVVWTASEAAAPQVKARVDRFLARAQRLEGIGDGVSASAAQVSHDGRVALVRLPLTTDRFDDVPTATGERLIAMAQETSARGVRVELGGLVIQDAQSQELSSEVIGLLIATVVLLLSFGTLVATGMPLATALFGLGISSATIGVLAALMDVPDWAPSVAAMIGIGVGIDYALLVVTRFRAALAAGADPRAATVEAVSTAGRSVLVAGTTVVISLLGLFLVGLTYLYGVALSAILAVVVAMAAAVTLLPALLAFTGRSINRLRIPGGSHGDGGGPATRAARWGRAVQRRPWTATLVAGAVLLALAAPVTGLRLGFPDAGNDPEGTTTRAAYELTTEGFGPGAAAPRMVVARVAAPADRERLAAMTSNLARQPGVASVGRPQFDRAGQTALVHILPRTGPQAAETADLLERVRGETAGSGLDVLVGGSTAAFVDQSESTLDRLPAFVGGVVGLSFLLLLLACRAPLVAVKAGVMNLFSIAAAYGLVALVADGGF